MSAVEGGRTVGHNGSSAPDRTRALGQADLDVPGILAGQVGELYAAAERERRDTGVERAIARARGAA
jgi:hypothetical protein